MIKGEKSGWQTSFSDTNPISREIPGRIHGGVKYWLDEFNPYLSEKTGTSRLRRTTNWDKGRGTIGFTGTK
jgi:hypothetical protein